MDPVKAVMIGLLVVGVVVIGETEATTCCATARVDCFKVCGESDECYRTCGCFSIPDVDPCPPETINVDTNVKPCCGDSFGMDCFMNCVRYNLSDCYPMCGCVPKAASDEECPPAPGNGLSYYCKLGCTSSVCERITSRFQTVGVSGETEVKKAVQHCNSACSQMCNIKGSKLQLAAVA